MVSGVVFYIFQLYVVGENLVLFYWPKVVVQSNKCKGANNKKFIFLKKIYYFLMRDFFFPEQISFFFS